ncbi:unnamed protein product [Orchesella dallaii]|uniref:Secreted protein n=1 Tax=Orchesella dallaii TaxID=48710 RepID=A0ABP1S0X2_9HEXA
MKLIHLGIVLFISIAWVASEDIKPKSDPLDIPAAIAAAATQIIDGIVNAIKGSVTPSPVPNSKAEGSGGEEKKGKGKRKKKKENQATAGLDDDD